MSKSANKKVIGAFVLGAIALAVIAVAIFGSGRYFKTSLVYVTHFEGTVNGLSVGAPVLFRGVQIGSVKDISLEFNPSTLKFDLPVTLEIYPDMSKRLGPPPKTKGELLPELINKGLKTQLITQSLITGQLAVAVDFYPNEPRKYYRTSTQYPEIPSIPSKVETISKELEKLPLKEIVAKIDSTLSGISGIVNSGATQASLKELEKLAKNLSETTKTVHARIDPLVDNVEKTSEQLRVSVASLENRLTEKGGTIDIANKTMAQAEKTLGALRQIAQENSAIGRDVGETVEEMSKSMRSLRVLSDYIERHPESIVRGKK